MKGQEFLTKEKKNELEQELQYLKTEKRQEILDRLAFAKSLGDLSENAEYHTSKEEQGKNEARIAQIEAVLKDAVLIRAKADGTVNLGSSVTIVKKDTKETKVYQIVGNEEADFAAGKISFESPIGVALMGKKKSDEAIVKTPKGETVYKIKEVK